MRASVSVGTIAVLVGALLSGGHQPTVEMLATAAVPLSDPAPATPPATAPQPPVHLPDPTRRSVRAPASSSKPPSRTGVPDVQGIPAVALEAYQRSAAVIDSADPSCGLDWSLLAAIGDVESDHGQVGGSRLSRSGVARPRIIGPRLDGRHGTSLVRDTDAGRLDGDRRFDHAVGPMQFLPSTWAAVAVDGDADGRRNVEDIDDASLGSAVYLCADHGDLSTRAGRLAALLRYNHSQAYAARVSAIARHYRTSGPAIPVTDLDVHPVSFDHSTTGRRHHGHHGRHGQHGRHGHGRHHHEAITASPGPGTSDPVPPTGGPTPTPPSGPGTPGDPGTPGNPGGPSTPPEPPVIPVPLPEELSQLTPDQVRAYDDAWAACDDDLVAGWSTDADVLASLTQCLADEVVVPVDDPDLLTFVDWLAHNEDPATSDPTDGPSGEPSDEPSDGPTDGPTDGAS